MTTLTAIVLDSFIESGAEKSTTVVDFSSNTKLERRHSIVDSWNDRGIDAPTSKVERGVSVPPKLVSPDPNSGSKVKAQPNAKLETRVSIPPNVKVDKGLDIPSKTRPDRRNGASTAATSFLDKKHHWTQITPALYATPESTPLPDAPSSFTPSPYIVNHKRRGPRLMNSFSEDEVATSDRVTDVNDNDDVSKDNEVCVAPDMVVNLNINGRLTSFGQDDVKEKVLNGANNQEHEGDNIGYSAADNNMGSCVTLSVPLDDEADDFVDPQDSVSVMSVGESEGIGATERSLNAVTPMAEFYDAWEELSSASESHNALPDIENELHDLRLSLFKEIEKRKQAEETLSNMRNQWQRIREQLSLVGLNLPLDPTSLPEAEDPAAEICQQVYLSRVVANSIGRATARAEVETEMEAQVNLKNFEIARLWDRLHYYKAVNQEMSQRNQEVIETARRLRQTRKRRQRWVFGSIATVVSVGSAVLAYSYLKSGKGSSSSSSSTQSN